MHQELKKKCTIIIIYEKPQCKNHYVTDPTQKSELIHKNYTNIKSDTMPAFYTRASAVENKQSANAKPKAQINCAVTAHLISAFVFATRIVTFFLHKSKISSF